MSRQKRSHPFSDLAGSLVQEDEDVVAERQRITSTPLDQLMQTDSLVLHGKQQRDILNIASVA